MSTATEQAWVSPADVDQWDADSVVSDHVCQAVMVAHNAVLDYYAKMIGQRPARAGFERRVDQTTVDFYGHLLDTPERGRSRRHHARRRRRPRSAPGYWVNSLKGGARFHRSRRD